MKHVIILIFLLTPFLGMQAQSSLEIEVELSEPEAGGMVLIALCRGTEAYETVKGCVERSAPANAPVVTLRFSDLPPGEYAIKAMHDINGNKEMDYNMLGIPKEPYGFSNDAKVIMSPPDFKDASFTVEPGKNKHRFRMKG